MNTFNSFHSLTKRYCIMSSRMCLARYLHWKHTKKLPVKFLPTLPLLIDSSVGGISYSHHICKKYSSEPSTAEKCASLYSSLSPLKFEELTFEPPVPHDELMEALRKCKSLSEQMETLASVMALSPKDIENRKKFCKTLESLFTPFFNNVKIQMFGSSVNHFGFKGCDIDMTFETSEPTDEPVEKVAYVDRPDVPLVNEVLSGKVSAQEVSRLPLREQLIFMHTVLLEYYKESSEPSIFINAHVPLVRFYHDKFNLKCDLTLKNDVAYANTKLLYFYARLDKRVVPLIMTIRYWAKHVELIGKGLMFNTYTITLMVIHFLQTRSPPVIPSAQSILSLSDSFNTEDMDDTSFSNHIENMPPSENSQAIDELLKEFFFYYLYFDYSRVIVPLTGNSIPRKEFYPMKHPKFIVNMLNVQDPLCIFNNTANLLDMSFFKKFYSECALVSKMFQDSEIISPSIQHWGLMAFMHKMDQYNFKKMDITKPTSFFLPIPSIITEDRPVLKNQALLIAKTVLKILEHSLLFECKVLEEKEAVEILETQDKLIDVKRKQLLSSKIVQEEFDILRKKKQNAKNHFGIGIDCLPQKTMVEQFQNMNAEHELILCCRFKVSKDICKTRELYQLDFSSLKTDILNQEHLISKEIVKEIDQNPSDKKKSYSYLLECYVKPNSHEQSIMVVLRPIPGKFDSDYGYKMQSTRLGIFLKDFIPKVINKMES